ncbi:MAG: family 43 glycosylhydrolase [Lachnospiraceae bacterium]|nr:family 43 glycosylhydrolase [Lachnospiraceae bacterium]
MAKRGNKFLGFVLTAGLVLQGVASFATPVRAESTKVLTEAEMTAALSQSQGTAMKKIDNNKVAVHDPSVIKNETKTGTEGLYYVFGSHMGVAKSDDLSTWTQVSAGENDAASKLFGVVKNGKTEVAPFTEAFKKNAYTGKVNVKYNGATTSAAIDFGTFDASAWHCAIDNYTDSGNMWAPDVIYNTTTKEYAMYLSLNGSKWNSAVILLTSKDIEGPYVYQGPVVITGFKAAEDKDALSMTNTDMKLVYKDLTKTPDQYKKVFDLIEKGEGTWGDYFPHAIDPAVFYDQKGNLRMVYGSWSGGIYEIELDEKTGLRDYTVQYAYKQGATERDIVSDPYFGIHIAGGWYVSGEGPYVEYIDGKYYLFMSYGGYAPDGNYQMRIFSSANPEGPYVDTTGVSAIYDKFTINFNADYGDCYGGSDFGAPGTTRGSRLMNGYSWDTMDKGEISQGHNSAITVGGKSYVIYHTKYDNGTVEHNLRCHELYTIDGALVAAPYQYDASVKDKTSYTTADVAGEVGVIFNRYDSNQHWSGGVSVANGGVGSNKNPGGFVCDTPEYMTFKDDGKVLLGNKEIGSWKIKSGKSMEITITSSYNNAYIPGTYDCLLVEQNADGVLKTCFTGICQKSGIGIWGTTESVTDEYAVAYTQAKKEVALPTATAYDITLPVEGCYGANVSWKSSNAKVMSDDGKVGKVTSRVEVTMTKTIAKGNVSYKKDYTVFVEPVDTTEGKVNVNLSKGKAGNTVDNPFKGEKIKNLNISYSVKLKKKSNAKGGVMTFYNSKTNKYAVVGAGGNIAFNAGSAGKLNVNVRKASTKLKANKKYTYKISISGKKLVIKENGKTVKTVKNAAVKKLLKFIKSCDRFVWGNGTKKYMKGKTEACKLSNVIISDKNATSFKGFKKSYGIGNNVKPVEFKNAFKGKSMDSLSVSYTINYKSVPDVYGGLFAFLNSKTGGRVSQQAIPYTCYNESLPDPNKWIDVKTFANYTDTGKNIKISYTVTPDEYRLYINGEYIKDLNIAGSGATYKDMLKFISTCDKFYVGVDSTSSFWGSVVEATIKNVNISINSISKVRAF